MSDLTSLDVSTAPGFDVAGFRCKAFVVCGAAMSCVYFAVDQNLGHRQSAEAMYYDGTAVTPGVPVKIWVTGGAQSGCVDANVTFAAGNYVTLTFDMGKSLKVYLPAFTGKEITLYVSQNGSTYRDAALTQLAAAAP
jgi:hypothetical protein